MGAVCSFKTLIPTDQTTRGHSPEHCSVNLRSREDLKYYTNMFSEILSFRTLSIVLVLKNKLGETRRFGNWICFRPQVRGKNPILLGLLERASPNHWTQQNRFFFRT
jgi:hypothetical protein